MRIAYVVHKFPPESLGGTEIYTWSLARQVAVLGHEVHVFYPQSSLSPDQVRIERDGLHLWRVLLPRSRHTEGFVRQYWHTFRDRAIEAAFQDFVAETRPQVVHFQHVQGVSARLIALARGRPRVLTLHDYWYFCANSQLVLPDRRVCAGSRTGWRCADCALGRADLQWLRRLGPLVALPFVYRNRYLRRQLAQIDQFIAPSEFLRQQYVRQGFSAKRILVMENGLDVARLGAGAGAGLLAPPARPHFGFLGSIVWQKGLHVLIEAFNSLTHEAALTIYGSEAAAPEYVEGVKAAAKHPHIRFAGRLDHRGVGAALRQLDYLVVPSLWFENSPLVIQEAYGVGLPVVASRLGALPEKVRDGETGRLFTPGDSSDLTRVLQELIEHPEMRATFVGNIRSGPTMQAHTKHLLEIYQGLRKGRRLAGASTR